MEKNNFDEWKNICNFSSDFKSEITKRYAPTADMNVRNSIGMQGMCSGSRVLAWTVSISLFQGNSHDLYQKKRHTVPRFF